jgi:hypothetical protein
MRYVRGHNSPRLLRDDGFTLEWVNSEAAAWFMGLWTTDGSLKKNGYLDITLKNADAVYQAAEVIGLPRERVGTKTPNRGNEVHHGRKVDCWTPFCNGEHAVQMATLLYGDCSYRMRRKAAEAANLISRWEARQRMLLALEEQRATAIAAYQQGESAAEIEQRYGIPRRRVFEVLKSAGIFASTAQATNAVLSATGRQIRITPGECVGTRMHL